MAFGLEFITRITSEGVAFVNTGQVFTAKYDSYFVQLEIAGSSTYNEIYLTDSSNARLNDNPADAHYDDAQIVMKSDTTWTNHKSENTFVGWREIGAYVDNQGEGYAMSFYVHNPFDSAKYTFVTASSSSMIADKYWGTIGVGGFKSAEQCNGLYLTNSGGGAMDYINANIYGVIK